MTKARDLSLAAKAPLASPVFTGNVGLGTSSPDERLHVMESSAGSVTAHTESVIVAERNGNCYFSAIGTTGAGLLMANTAGNEIGRINYGFSDNIMQFYTSNAEALRINSAGIVTKPLQPAFSAQAVATNNFGVGAWHIMNCTEIFDNNADFNPSTNKFTAPVTGRYQLNLTLRLDNLQTNASYFYVNIQTSNRANYNIMATDGYDAAVPYFGISTSVLADMDAGDTANVNYYIAAGSSVSDIHNESRFTGFLVC